MLSRRPSAGALKAKRLGNGAVKRAVICVLDGADRALPVTEVQGGVEERLGGAGFQGLGP
jgi:hypothetical protein